MGRAIEELPRQRLILDDHLPIDLSLDHRNPHLLCGLQREVVVSCIASSIPANADDPIMQVCLTFGHASNSTVDAGRNLQRRKRTRGRAVIVTTRPF
jgi:hypothetical protein